MTSFIPDNVELGKSVIYQEVRDEAVLLDLNSQAYYGLDDVGTAIWKQLLEDGNVEAAIARLTVLFDVDKETIRTDTHSLIRELISANLLQAQS